MLLSALNAFAKLLYGNKSSLGERLQLKMVRHNDSSKNRSK